MGKNLVEYKSYANEVSVIVTAMTDGEKPFLFEALESVLQDPIINKVVLCIDKDNDWIDIILGSFLNDKRLDIYRIPKMRIACVRNLAIDRIETPWVAYLDGDDVWCKGKTSIQLNYAIQKGADFVATGNYIIDENSKLCAVSLSFFIAMPSSWLVRTELMKKYKFNEQLITGSDGEWWAKTNSFITKVKCPKLLMRYRVRSESVSASSFSKIRKHRTVDLSRIPVLGIGVLVVTYLIWIATRYNNYRWKPSWSRPEAFKNI